MIEEVDGRDITTIEWCGYSLKLTDREINELYDVVKKIVKAQRRRSKRQEKIIECEVIH